METASILPSHMGKDWLIQDAQGIIFPISKGMNLGFCEK